MAEKVEKKSGSKKVMIVEDEVSLQSVLKLKLESIGVIVTTASNGTEALEKAITEKYDLILLDLIMPELDGFGVLKGLKEKGVNTKVIVLSNLSQPEDESKAKELGAVGFYIKSNTPIAKIVDEVLLQLK